MKRTFQRSTVKRQRKHGFRNRNAQVINNRRRKGRKLLAKTAAK